MYGSLGDKLSTRLRLENNITTAEIKQKSTINLNDRIMQFGLRE
jgi:hypothetical protein